jgi:hypothetical protein
MMNVTFFHSSSPKGELRISTIASWLDCLTPWIISVAIASCCVTEFAGAASAADWPIGRTLSTSVCVWKGREAGRLSEYGRKQHPPVKELAVGEERLLPELCPGERFFPSGLLVTPGATYRITAEGRWKDWWIPAGPNGWWFPPLQANNRIPGARMFVLSGSVGMTLVHAFVIGERMTWTAPSVLSSGADRQLYLFPNDWESAYDNNRVLSPSCGGPMRVSIHRLL